jgi:hypothetical protein
MSSAASLPKSEPKFEPPNLSNAKDRTYGHKRPTGSNKVKQMQVAGSDDYSPVMLCASEVIWDELHRR